jgi:hypothetical protein
MLKQGLMIIGTTVLVSAIVAAPARAQSQSQQTDPCASATDKVQCALDRSVAKLDSMRVEAAKRDAERLRVIAEAQKQAEEKKASAATTKTTPMTKGKKPADACKTYPVCAAK